MFELIKILQVLQYNLCVRRAVNFQRHAIFQKVTKYFDLQGDNIVLSSLVTYQLSNFEKSFFNSIYNIVYDTALTDNVRGVGLKGSRCGKFGEDKAKRLRAIFQNAHQR